MDQSQRERDRSRKNLHLILMWPDQRFLLRYHYPYYNSILYDIYLKYHRNGEVKKLTSPPKNLCHCVDAGARPLNSKVA